ncbi:phosphoribosylglycinamide formyltransferase [Flavobacterium sp. K5-23]|uniref:phosphoribosylglycinamide formyltransferase n=1 Tax=Flavobacterium sp. K5-23 TaxID=2746225 RepID=UPI00200BCAFB|nr:phosphoribosylglycinamide formyltransferase [Flavobacterium sp. K5-23]UQD55425.1 phosphoribosylglycinamide formyltransferase [Flavobacterium sp. K5-23]
MKKIVVFASGSGSNAENIIKYFAKGKTGVVVSVFTNNANAKVIERSKKNGVSVEIFSKEDLNESKVLHKINQIKPDLIVLAGFLLKFPEDIVAAYPDKIINIHPALLPKYGGKGMYGIRVHQAVVDNKDVETGITIHYVNDHYDEGNVIFQATVLLSGSESADEVAAKIHELEQEHFPLVIEKLLTSNL